MSALGSADHGRSSATKSPAVWYTALSASGLIVTLATLAPDIRAVRFLAVPLMIFAVATFFLWLPWMAVTWKAVPTAVRAKVAPGLSPSQMVGRYFIPVYWFNWAFAAQGHLANAVDVWLDRDVTMKKSAPHSAAVALVVATLVCLVLAKVAGVPWVLLVVRAGWLGVMARYDVLVARGLVDQEEISSA